MKQKRYKVLLAARYRWLTSARLPALLHRCGYEVDVFGPERTSAARSLYANVLTQGWGAEDQLIDRLEAYLFGEPGYIDDYDWIIFLDDGILELLVEAATKDDRWNRCMPVNPERFTPEAVASKTKFNSIAKAAGLPIPDFVEISHQRDFDSAAQKLTFPLIYKPRHQWAGMGVTRIDTPEELDGARDAFKKYGEGLLQNFIEGRVCLFEVLYSNGNPVFYATTCKAKTISGPMGPSSQRLSIYNPNVDFLVHEIGNLTGFHGLCGVDFIEDQTTKDIYIIEMNFRPTSINPYWKYFGIDFKRGILGFLSDNYSLQTPQHHEESPVHTYSCPEELSRCIRASDWKSLLQCLTSLQFWQCFPWNDPPLWRIFAGELYSTWKYKRPEK
jgi:hypothetical protein